MGLLSVLKGGAVEQLTRTILVLPENDEKLAPKMEMDIVFLSREHLDRLQRQTRNKGVTEKDLTKSKEFRQLCFKDLVKGWKGLSPNNLQRISEYALQRPALVAELEADIPYSDDDRDFLSEIIDIFTFSNIVDACGSLEGFAMDLMQEGKKKLPPLSDFA